MCCLIGEGVVVGEGVGRDAKEAVWGGRVRVRKGAGKALYEIIWSESGLMRNVFVEHGLAVAARFVFVFEKFVLRRGVVI